MAQGILLDTSAIIPHLRGNPAYLAQAESTDEPLFVSLTVLGELYRGVLKSSQQDKNRLVLETFLQTVAILHPDSATSLYYAQVSVDLERMGKIIPENDIWIAASALECGMPLVTRDAHFQHVTGLQLLYW